MTQERSTTPSGTDGLAAGEERHGSSSGGEVETVTFTEWRRTRPLAGALLLVVGGAIVAWFPFQALVAYQPSLVAGLGLLFGLGIVFAGVAAVVRPSLSTIAGVSGLALSAASFVFTFGGFVVGMLVAGAGGVLCFAWSPEEKRVDADGAD